MKQKFLLTGGAVLLLVSLLIFGRIETRKQPLPAIAHPTALNINDIIAKAKANLSSSQNLYLTQLENSVKREDVKNQQSTQLDQLSAFWKDSARQFVPYAYYLSEGAKLDNSEKKLTFAARLILDSMRAEENPMLKGWEADRAVELFERAIVLDPNSGDLKIGLGSCYVYGKGMTGDAAETMKGIQQLLQVVRKDSNNMKAQMVLGVGGVVSRQYDKAIERLNKVVAFDHKNLEAVSWLADAYAGKGDKQNATKWYEYSKALVNNPEFSKAVNERIKELQ